MTTPQEKQIEKRERPIRAGLYKTLEAADRAIRELLNAGFTIEQVTVVCSDKYKESHFKQFEHQDPAGTHTGASALAGGAIGATLGGLAAVIGFAATGGVGLLVAGGIAAWTGGVFGGLVGAMMSRGVERELANYYNQAVQQGMILVAVDYAGPDSGARLAQAEEILAEAGAEPVALPEG